MQPWEVKQDTFKLEIRHKLPWKGLTTGTDYQEKL